MAVSNNPSPIYINAGITSASLFQQIDEIVKIAPDESTLDDTKTKGRDDRLNRKNIVAFIVQRTASLPPSAPAGVSWVTKPGIPIFTLNEIQETSSTIRVNNINRAVASKTLTFPFASANGERRDAIAVKVFDPISGAPVIPPVYERLPGLEEHYLNVIPDPVIPEGYLFVRFVKVTDGVLDPAPVTPVNSILTSDGKTRIPDPITGLLDLSDLESYSDAEAVAAGKTNIGTDPGNFAPGEVIPILLDAIASLGSDLDAAEAKIAALTTDIYFYFDDVQIDAEAKIALTHKYQFLTTGGVEISGDISSITYQLRADINPAWSAVKTTISDVNDWIALNISEGVNYWIKINRTRAAGGAGAAQVTLIGKIIA